MQNENKLQLPTEMVELPSKGLLYPPDNPLSAGSVEMKYMTAKEEDILSNQNYLKQGIVFDKLLQSLIVTKINYDDMLIGDKNAVMVAARILGYGKDYEVTITHPQTGEPEKTIIDLSQIKEKPFDATLIKPGVNEFSFTLPTSKNEVVFKLLTHGDENTIDQELKGLKKANISSEVTTRLKQSIIAVNGNSEKKAVRDFVDNYLLAADARALRQYMKKVAPDLDLTFTFEAADGYIQEGVEMPIGLSFFYPTA